VRDIKELLRLRFELGLGCERIARAPWDTSTSKLFLFSPRMRATNS
jgi:hypothetical protein